MDIVGEMNLEDEPEQDVLALLCSRPLQSIRRVSRYSVELDHCWVPYTWPCSGSRDVEVMVQRRLNERKQLDAVDAGGLENLSP